MTLPATAGRDHRLATPGTLPIESPPAPASERLLRAALAADVSPKAFRLYTVMVLNMPSDRWHTTVAIGHAAGVSDHTVRPLVAELVRARLVRDQKMVGTSPAGLPSVRRGYSVAVTA